MNPDKDELLEKCHADFLDICLGDFPLEMLYTRVSDKVTGYGTNINEKIQSLDDLVSLLRMQREESEGIEMKLQFHSISKTQLAQNMAAVYVDEVNLIMIIQGGKLELQLRLTSTYEYSNDRWMVVNFHGSIAQGEEGKRDTWAVNEWKEKNAKLEKVIEERTEELNRSLNDLKSTQEQLVVQEKLAALGQLAAGIAHEIKNPMNFVNNFSEVSLEYIDEINELVDEFPKNDNIYEIKELLGDVRDNLKKIHQHGTRADSIVKSMLMHSRGGSGELEPTDLNELLHEYVNLAFHGMRAGKNPINVQIDYHLSDKVGIVPLYPEDFSRVILNLCKNAFDAMRDKTKESENGSYLPTISISSSLENDKAKVVFEDNGPGIPEEIRKKLFEPFFTTKKGTEGTGLGLSITHDIIKNHKGQISIESEPGKFTRFNIEIPITNQNK